MTQPCVDVAGTGFAVLDRVYADDQEPFEALGGSCGNVLISLAMLEHSVVPLLSFGSDRVGDFLVDEFARAGADTRYIFRRADMSSPVLAQQLDTSSGQHWFSFVCPITDERLPPYRSIDEAEVSSAEPVLHACSVFYVDRVSQATVQAIEKAADAGATIYFEPSSVEDDALFERAIAMATIVKCSSERLGDWIATAKLGTDVLCIVTHGAEGLELRREGRHIWCKAIPATVVRDTCGAGDMLSVGLIDWLLGRLGHSPGRWTLDEIIEGVVAGQRLSAANCAFAGARGLFTHHGARFARLVLEGRAGDAMSQLDLFDDCLD
jgi:fructokinase